MSPYSAEGPWPDEPRRQVPCQAVTLAQRGILARGWFDHHSRDHHAVLVACLVRGHRAARVVRERGRRCGPLRCPHRSCCCLRGLDQLRRVVRRRRRDACTSRVFFPGSATRPRAYW